MALFAVSGFAGFGAKSAYASTLAQSVWTRTNPGGGGAFSTIGAGPTGIIIAASDLAGAYRSVDGGASWDLIGSFDGLTSTHVSGVGFDPDDGTILYLGTDNGLFRSTDGGATVTEVLAGGYLTDIQFAESNPMIGYVARQSAYNTNGGVIYKTTNRGQNWSQISNGTLPSNLHILKILADPNDTNTLYVLSGEGRFHRAADGGLVCGPASVYRSQDGGINWTDLTSTLGQVIDVALDHNNAATLYMTTYGDVWDPGYDCIQDDSNGGKLYKSTNAGSNWSPLGLPDSTPRNTAIWLDRDDQQAIRLISTDYPQIWESTNDGTSWTFLGDKANWATGWTATQNAYSESFNGNAKTRGEDLSDPDALLWIDSQFVYATRDDALTFNQLFTNNQGGDKWQSTGVDNIVMLDIAVSPVDDRYVYLALADLGCFRSDDSGASWQACNVDGYTGDWWGEKGGNSFTVAADPARTAAVWISQADEVTGTHTLLRSNNAGDTWVESNSGLPGTVLSGLSVDPNSPVNQRVLYVTAGGDIYRSTDDGYTWSLVDSCGGCHYTAVDSFNRDLVYAGGEAGLLRSTDGGDNWSSVGLPAMQGSLGSTFWDKYWAGVADIVVDPINTGTLYVTAFGVNKGLYRSTNSGTTWEKLLTDDFMRGVAVSPTNTDAIFATSASAVYSGGYEAGSSGVQLSLDGGQSFQQVNQGLDWPFAFPIEISVQEPTKVYLGSPGGGIYTRTFPELVGSGAVNLLTNGDFSDEATGWSTWGNYTSDTSGDEFCMFFDPNMPNPNLWDAGVEQSGIQIEAGQAYQLQFNLWSQSAAQIRAIIGESQSPYLTYFTQDVNLAANDLQTYSYQFTMTEATDPNAVLSFHVGGHSSAVVCLDEVSLTSVDAPGTPNLIEPNGEISTFLPYFAWQPAANAHTYTLVVYDVVAENIIHMEDFSSSICTATICSTQIGLSLPSGNYTWLVQAINSAGVAGDWGIWTSN